MIETIIPECQSASGPDQTATNRQPPGISVDAVRLAQWPEASLFIFRRQKSRRVNLWTSETQTIVKRLGSTLPANDLVMAGRARFFEKLNRLLVKNARH